MNSHFSAAVSKGTALIIVTLAGALPAAATTIFVDQNATYRYINATVATTQPSPGPNWFKPGFDDSGWFVGSGPFSSSPVSATILENPNANGPFAPGATQPVPTTFTHWDINHDPFLRTDFTLTAPTALTVWIAVDNGIGTAVNNPQNGTGAATGMYINGVLSTGFVNAEGHAFRWESVFNIAADDTVAGNNVFALQLEDHGNFTGFDMMITSQVGDNPPFTTNAPPVGVAEPASLILFGVGLAGLGMAGRRRAA